VNILYLAKEPDQGVKSDLTELSKLGEVTVVACNPGYVDFYEKIGYNCITKDVFFELDGSMKFDYIIGNPPYTDTSTKSGSMNSGGCSKDLDCVFFEKAMKQSDVVSLIIRSKFFAKKSSIFRRKLFSTGKIKSIRVLPKETFPILGTEICVVTYDINHKGSSLVTFYDGTVKEINIDKDTCIKFTNPNYVPEVDNNLAYRYFRGTVTKTVAESTPGEYPMITTMGGKSGNMEDNVLMVDESLHTQCVNQHGVVMNSKYGGDKGTGSIEVKPYEYSISGSTVILKTDSYEESVKLRDYMLTDEVQQIVIKNRISNANTKELFMTIPDID
jgi:hypothetical protein